LMQQFKIERQHRRIEISLPVTLTAADVKGRALDEQVATINVSQRGALLTGIRGKLRMGTQVSLARLNKREQFLIAWVGEDNTARAGQIGVSAVDSASSFWNDVAGTESQAEPASAQAKPKARAHGA
jgi:hypothetical protein